MWASEKLTPKCRRHVSVNSASSSRRPGKLSQNFDGFGQFKSEFCRRCHRCIWVTLFPAYSWLSPDIRENVRECPHSGERSGKRRGDNHYAASCVGGHNQARKLKSHQFCMQLCISLLLELIYLVFAHYKLTISFTHFRINFPKYLPIPCIFFFNLQRFF